MWKSAKRPRMWTPHRPSYSKKGYSADTEFRKSCFPTTALSLIHATSQSFLMINSLCTSLPFPDIPNPTEKWRGWFKLSRWSCSDEYLALLNYRDSPSHHGHSPAELSMGRKLCTRVTHHPDELKPKIPEHDQITKKERVYSTKTKFDYDHRHRVVEGKE